MYLPRQAIAMDLCGMDRKRAGGEVAGINAISALIHYIDCIRIKLLVVLLDEWARLLHSHSLTMSLYSF